MGAVVEVRTVVRAVKMEYRGLVYICSEHIELLGEIREPAAVKDR